MPSELTKMNYDEVSAAGSFECSECGGEDFHHGRLEGHARFSIFRKTTVQCSICLSCGHVFTFVDDADLARIRLWKGKKADD